MGGGIRRVDRTPVALLDQVRQVAAVIDMCMREDYRINFEWVKSEFSVAFLCFLAAPLVETTLQQQALTVNFE